MPPLAPRRLPDAPLCDSVLLTLGLCLSTGSLRQLREMERERESLHGGPRAVSSPQVGMERERGAASVAQDAGLPRLPVSSQPPDRSNLPHIVGGLG